MAICYQNGSDKALVLGDCQFKLNESVHIMLVMDTEKATTVRREVKTEERSVTMLTD